MLGEAFADSPKSKLLSPGKHSVWFELRWMADGSGASVLRGNEIEETDQHLEQQWRILKFHLCICLVAHIILSVRSAE